MFHRITYEQDDNATSYDIFGVCIYMDWDIGESYFLSEDNLEVFKSF